MKIHISNGSIDICEKIVLITLVSHFKTSQVMSAIICEFNQSVIFVFESRCALTLKHFPSQKISYR